MRGIEGGAGKCSRSSSTWKFFPFLLAAQRNPDLLEWSGPTGNLCYGSGLGILESDVIDEGAGSLVDAKYVFLECSKMPLSRGPVWNMSWGRVEEPRTNCFGEGQPQAEVLTT